ncbi:unnamed protein product, partial [Prorocentrum cordatum]
ARGCRCGRARWCSPPAGSCRRPGPGRAPSPTRRACSGGGDLRPPPRRGRVAPGRGGGGGGRVQAAPAAAAAAAGRGEDLSPQELATIEAETLASELPPGFYFDGTTYMDVDGRAQPGHPLRAQRLGPRILGPSERGGGRPELPPCAGGSAARVRGGPPVRAARSGASASRQDRLARRGAPVRSRRSAR